MYRYVIGSLWERNNRNGMNSNFEYLFEGRKKIDDLNYRAEGILSEAQNINDMNKDVQNQLDNLIIESGNANAEVSQARGDAPLLKDRLDKTDSQLAQTEKKIIREKDNSFHDRIVHNKKNKPVIVYIDDDARKEVFTLLKPLAERMNVPITSCVITSRIDNDPAHLTSPEMEECSSAGIEFVSHTHRHINLQEAPTEELIHEDLKASRNWLLDRGYNADTLVYPFGIADNRAREIVSKYFRYGILSDRGEGVINRTPLISYGLQRAYIDYGVEYIKDRMDDINANGGMLIVGMHCHYEDFNIDWVEETMEYAQTLGIDIVNMEQAHSYYGNFLEIGNASAPHIGGAVIDSTGTVHGELLGRVISRTMTNKDLTKAMNEFEYNAITRGHVSSAEASGFPQNRAGRFTVHRFKSPTFDYQEYEVYNSGIIYRRTWDGITNSWTSFEIHNIPTTRQQVINWSKTQAINHTAMEAHSVAQFNVNSSLFVPGRVIVANPVVPLTSKVTWSCYVYTNGVAHLNVHNPSAETIPPQTVEWKLIAIDVV